MASRIRVLDSANRTMQRLGYLKPLCALVNATETSNLETLGKRLIERVTKRVRAYVKNRLTDRLDHDLRKAVLESANGQAVHMEVQDVYLADANLPSRTGKLVEANWRRYPYLGTSLELIKKGTYSALTRSLVLLAVTPEAELRAFQEADRAHNQLPDCWANRRSETLVGCVQTPRWFRMGDGMLQSGSGSLTYHVPLWMVPFEACCRLSRPPVRNPGQPPRHAGTFLPRGPRKPAQCKRLKSPGSYRGQIDAPLAQLTSKENLHYVFAFDLDGTWVDYLIISRETLDDLRVNAGIGSQYLKGDKFHIKLGFTFETIGENAGLSTTTRTPVQKS
jgi:hypothetical protein